MKHTCHGFHLSKWHRKLFFLPTGCDSLEGNTEEIVRSPVWEKQFPLMKTSLFFKASRGDGGNNKYPADMWNIAIDCLDRKEDFIPSSTLTQGTIIEFNVVIVSKCSFFVIKTGLRVSA